MINIAILGYGVVGSGVVEVVKKNTISIKARAGKEIIVKKILDIRDFPDSPDRELLTKDSGEIFNDDSISIVVETIGGAKIAYEFTKKALMSGKSVVTSNKELVATRGPELLKLARDNNVKYLFEASVGGGIPIIRPLNQCLAANEIISIAGILNGTTNYILTKMKREGKDFETALKGAQENGYAEKDPTADIEGIDSCRKIAILSSIAYNQFVDCNNIYTEGISNISPIDIKYAEAMNSTIKLIAKSKRMGDKVFARVSPAIISKSHPLATVEDVFNAIVVSGDAIGDAMFYGRGAGKLPTASAVVADVIDIVKHMGSNPVHVWEIKDYDNMININDTESRIFVRLESKIPEEAKREVAKKFKKVDFVILNGYNVTTELAFTTDILMENELSKILDELKEMSCVSKIISTIRIED